MFHMTIKDSGVKIGTGVRCEMTLGHRLSVSSIGGKKLGMTQEIDDEIVSQWQLSPRRPLYGVVIAVNNGLAYLHLVAPGRFREELETKAGRDYHDAKIKQFVPAGDDHPFHEKEAA